MSIEIAVAETRPLGIGWRRTLAFLATIAAGDVLLFREPHGINWLIFGAVLAAAILTIYPPHDARRAPVVQAMVPLTALAPLAENVSPLSFLVAMVGLAVFALTSARRLRLGIASIGRQLVAFFFSIPGRLIGDAVKARRIRRQVHAGRLVQLLGWALAFVFGGIFILLFGIANPIVETWLELLDVWAWLAKLDLDRVLFWLIVAVPVWAYLRPRLPRARKARAIARTAGGMAKASTAIPQTFSDLLFGRAALLRALLTFNVIFLVQNALDMAYLWGGVTLPEGMTYAAYAHRGAYPLIVTALLAAGFVLAAMRPGSITSADRAIRHLVYLWTAQNVWLVVSSILRLDLYVAVYSLTYWRIAAFVWMGLVATGLLFVIARIALKRSNEWLTSANLLTLSAVLYACCFINFGAFIASYNVDHSREMTGEGLSIDQYYLRTLGPAAFPAIDRLLAGTNPRDPCMLMSETVCLATTRIQDEAAFRAKSANWRSWSFRNARLMRYLDGVQAAPRSLPAEKE